jgi:hypothetical protein
MRAAAALEHPHLRDEERLLSAKGSAALPNALRPALVPSGRYLNRAVD